MTNGLSVNDITPLGERPADVWRGRTGVLGAGVFTISGSPLEGSPTLSGDFYVYDPATDSWVIINTASIVPAGEFLTTTEGEQHAVETIAASGATATIDCSLANIFDITLTANCTLTITNPPPSGVGGIIQVILRQGGTGSYTVTWPAAVVWAAADGTSAGSAPTLFTAVGAEDVVILATLDGGTTWGGARETGSAGVTSVALTVPAEFSVAGSPVTSSGTLAVTKATQSANAVWAGPTSGAAAQPTFRALVAADLTAAVAGAVPFTIIGQETRASDGSTTAWTLDNDFEANSVQAFNLTTGKALVVTETLPNTATIGAAGSAGDVLSFAYAASAI